MRGRALLLASAVFAVASLAFSSVVYVKFDASGANTGTSWTDAYTSLQSALASAISGDEIWVAAGTYKPTSMTNRNVSFGLKTGVGVYGGFAGTESSRNQWNPASNITILSGDIGTVGVATDNSYHVVSADATVTDSGILDGFTITGGQADAASAPDDRGGAVIVSSGSPTVANCLFTGNHAGTRGGAVRVDGGAASFSDCTFQANTSGLAGGAVSAGTVTSLSLLRCVVLGNSAADSTRGGGIDVTNNVSAVDCLIAQNSENGVEYFQGGNSLLDSTVTGHPGYGVAILSGTSTLTNSILWGDATGEVFSSGVLVATYSDVQGGFAGTGNLNSDPLFVNPAVHDWRLGPGSPAVDSGSNSAVPAGITLDLAGRPRFFDDPAVPDTGLGTAPIVDMGAYERIPLSVTNPANATVCAGAVATFSVTASGQAPFSYRWRKNGTNLSDGASISGSTTATLTINPAAAADAGSYDIVVADAFNQTVISSVATLTVNAVPTAPAAGNNGPICAGQTLQLTASTVAGATYSWSGPGGFSSNQQNPSIASATTGASGTYAVRVTVNGCVSAPATTAATVNASPAAPAAGNNGPICAGQTLQLTASTVAGATYSWSGPGGFSSSQQNPSILAAPASASGVYTVTVTVNGCSSPGATTTVAVRPLPSAAISTPSSVCAGSSGNVASVPDAGPGSSYSWSITNGTITGGAGTRSIAFSAGASDSVGLSISVSDVNGCSANGSSTLPISGACLSFYTLPPCRVIDTRNPNGPLGGPSLAAGADRSFVVAGTCGIPSGARAVSLNVVVVQPTNGPGFLTLYPGGTSLPVVSTLNYRVGQTRANNAIIPLGVGGDLTAHLGQGGGTADLVIDVNGYFR